MDSWGYLHRWRYGTWQCVGLGALAGGFEAISLAASSLLSLSMLDAALVGCVAVGAMAAVGAGTGAIAGLPLNALHRDETRPSTTLALQMAVATMGLVGFYLWQRAFVLASEGAPAGGWIALSAMPVGFAGVAYFNARFWLRKVELDRPAPVGWVPVAVGTSLVLALGAAVTWPLRDVGGAMALEGDPNLVLVTIDGLRHDDVGALGGAATPAFDALAERGALFTDAVSPTPGTRAANASVLVGLHPLRLKVLDDDDPLSRGYSSAFEALEEEGWATAAFVSSPVVGSGSGLEQGFRAYDDDFTPGPSGLGALWIVRDGLALGHALGIPVPWRAGSDTAASAAAWIGRHGEHPFAVWVHLADPLLSETPAAGLRTIDTALGALVDAVHDAEATDRTTFIVAGSHGALRGAHGGQGNRTLFDEVIRVPLVVVPPQRPAVVRIDAQVRLMDLANTAVVLMGLDVLPNSEGIPLDAYLTGERTHTIWSPLVGQDLDGTWLVGMRNNGVKVVRSELGNERMYGLASDPGETTDIAAEQPSTLNTARQLLAAEQVALDKLR